MAACAIARHLPRVDHAGRHPAAGAVTGIAGGGGRDVVTGLGSGRGSAALLVTLGTSARRPAEYPLDVTGFAARLLVQAREQETGRGVAEFFHRPVRLARRAGQ